MAVKSLILLPIYRTHIPQKGWSPLLLIKQTDIKDDLVTENCMWLSTVQEFQKITQDLMLMISSSPC